MDHSFLKFYNDELLLIRDKAKGFSQNHPDIAEQLNINSERAEDPMISKLIESFAFLTANSKKIMDDNQYKIPETLLDIFFPEYLQPLPCSTLITFNPTKESKAAEVIAKNTTLLTAIKKQPCYFNTKYDLHCIPYSLDGIALEQQAKNTSRIKLHLTEHQALNSLIETQAISFQFKPDSDDALRLYSIITNNCDSIILASELSQQKVKIKKTRLQQHNQSNENISTHAILQLYAHNKAELLAFDIVAANGGAITLAKEFDIIFSCKAVIDEKTHFDHDLLLLNSTFIVNLFNIDAEPINIDHKQTKYPLKIYSHQPNNEMEFHSVNSMHIFEHDAELEVTKLYSDNYITSRLHYEVHYETDHGNHNAHPIDKYITYISLIHSNDKINSTESITLYPEVMACNKNLPEKITDHTRQSYTFKDKVYKYQPLQMTPFTVYNTRPSNRLSHITLLRLLTMSNKSHAPLILTKSFLKNIFDIFNINNNQTMPLIDSISTIEHNKALMRSDKHRGLSLGIKINIIYSSQDASPVEMYFFIDVINYYCLLIRPINHLIQLQLTDIKLNSIQYWKPE